MDKQAQHRNAAYYISLYTKLGGYLHWALSPKIHEWIGNNFSAGAVVVELGSGIGSGVLSEAYKVYSIENDPNWLNKFKTNYIYAPIVNGWYDRQRVEKALSKIPKYDLIIVDGPPGAIGREGFVKNLDLFDISVPILFDDVNRDVEKKMANEVAKITGRPVTIYPTGDLRQFAVV